MYQPTGFEKGENLVCKLKRSLYGLTPAARIWYDTLTAYLRSIGFKVCDYDAGLFIHQSWKNLYLTSHVDDFKIVAANPEDAQWVVDSMSSRFEMKDASTMRFYLGMEVTFHDGAISLSQAEFIKDFINSFGMENAHTHRTPLDSGMQIDDEPDTSINTREYQRGTGKLQWLATKTRPDIAHAACILAQFNSAPTRKCWNGLIHVIKYLKGSIDKKIIYRQGEIKSPLPIGYSDSDWAGPSTGRKSIGGFMFLYGGAPISWQSKKQTCVATSSNEAEYIAASEAAKEAIWLRRVCIDMGIRLPRPDGQADGISPPITLNMDNQGAIALTSTEGTKRSKHIDIRYHHIRDLQAMGMISIKNVRSEEMAADGLTKILRTEQFNHFLDLVRMRGDME